MNEVATRYLVPQCLFADDTLPSCLSRPRIRLVQSRDRCFVGVRCVRRFPGREVRGTLMPFR